MKYLEICRRSQVFNQIGGNSSFVPISLVVEVEHMRLGIFVFLVLYEVVDRREVRERFHAKFAVKSSPESVEDLILFLCSMPDFQMLAE